MLGAAGPGLGWGLVDAGGPNGLGVGGLVVAARTGVVRVGDGVPLGRIADLCHTACLNKEKREEKNILFEDVFGRWGW